MTLDPHAALRRRVLDAATSPAPTRHQALWSSALLLLTGVATGGGLFLLVGGLHPAARPTSLMALTTLGWGVIAGAATWLAFARSRSAVGRPRAVLAAMLVLTPALLLAWKTYWSAQYPGMMEPWVDRIGLRCFGLTFLFALGLFAAMLVARRGSDPVHPALTGAALGVAAGACSGILVDLWCPVGFLPHLLLGHILPLAGLAAAGAWLGGRVVAMRRGA